MSRFLRGLNFARYAVVIVSLISVSSSHVNAKPRHVVKNRKIKTCCGGTVSLLDTGKHNVLFFFSIEKAYSIDALKELEVIRKDYAKKKKQVRFLAIISSRYSKAKVVEALRKAKVTMSVGRDDKDLLYGELDLKMRPTVVCIDKHRRVIGHQVYRRINFENIMRAHIRFALGEISKSALDAVLHPKDRGVGTGGGSHVAALRQWRLGKLLFKSGALAGALHAAKKAIKDDSKLAAAHLLMGQILAAQKHCGVAKAAFARALKLDASLKDAKVGAAACKGAKR